jgi:hypothetical protein
MAHQFKTVTQAAVMLAVQPLFGGIGHTQDLLGIVVVLTAAVDLQLDSQKQTAVGAEKDRVGLVVVGLDGYTASLVKTLPTVSLIVVPIVVGLVIGDQESAPIAGGKVIGVAMETKHPIPVPLAVFPPYAVPAVIAQNGPSAVAVIAKKPPVELPPLILLQHASAFGADQLVMIFKIFAHVLPPIIIDLVYYRRNIT